MRLCRAACAGAVLTLLTAAWPVNAQSILGTVTDAYSDRPLEGVTVVLVGTLHATITESTGAFALGPLPAGSYEIAASRHRYIAVRQRVVIGADQNVTVALRLVPEYSDVPWLAAVASLGSKTMRGPFYEAVRRAATVQVGRRSLYDYAPVIRGMHGAQVATQVDGWPSMLGSPYGPVLPVLMLPYELEVVAGPYALTRAPGTFSVVRIHMPFRHVTLAEAGYQTSPGAYDAAVLVGRVQHGLAYELTGSYGRAQGYKDRTGRQLLPDMEARAVRGRGRVRRQSAEVEVQAGYHGRDMEGAGGIHQVDAGVRLVQRLRSCVLRSLEAGAVWQRRTLSAWPYADAQDHQEEQAGASVSLRFAPIRGWKLTTGLDVAGVRYGRERLDQAGVYAYGARQAGRVRISGVVRGQGVLLEDQPSEAHLSAAAGAEIAMTPRLRLLLAAGTAARTAGVYERYGHRAPYTRMPLRYVVDGNAAVRPERILQGDLGLHHTARRTRASASVFARRILRQIDVALGPQYVNVHAAAFGGEAAFSQTLPGELVRFSVQAAYITGYPRRLTAVAPFSSRAALVFEAPAELFAIELDMEGATPARFEAIDGVHRVPGYVAVGARFRAALPRGFSLMVGAANLTDARYGLHASGLLPHARVLEEPGRQ